MNDPHNPYAPSALQYPSQELSVRNSVKPAGQGLRLANLFIDYFAQFAISFVLGITLVLIGGEQGAELLEKTPGILIGVPILLGYYIAFEATTGRTLGKLITGTKVVNEDGGIPTFGQIVGRSFCRLIPFEAFSFLGATTRGWHDSIPKTYVVKSR